LCQWVMAPVTCATNFVVLTASFLSALALKEDPSPYFEVNASGFIVSSRWKDRILPADAVIDSNWAHVPVDIPGYGRVLGNVHEGADFFLGMPYAQPPLGALRFKAAQPVGNLTGILNASQFCPSAIGAGDMRQARQITLKNDAKTDTHEDSLCVNVWRPSNTSHLPGKATPIMVFIYGGGFVSGSSTNAWYDGKNLAQYQKVILVTLNYRVGPLGFWSHEDLVSIASGTGGSNGLLDQVAALKWVNQNGAAFGGDVSNIGIFGESAGALSVCSHLVSPKSAGLFTRAIIESGACNGPWGVGEKAHGMAISKMMSARFNCSAVPGHEVDCMRDVPASFIEYWPWKYEMDQSLMDESKLTPYDWEFPGYWVDDFFLPAQQYQMFENATINAKAVMIVANSMDGFLSFLWPDVTDYTNMSMNCTGATYGAAQEYHWQHFSASATIATAVETHYPCSFGNHPGKPVSDAAWQFALADRDYNLHCASNSLADTLQKRGVGVWRATFSVGPRQYDQACIDGMVPCCQSAGTCYGWASHGAEIPFVFNTSRNACKSESVCDEFIDPFSGTEPALVQSMNNYWVSFLTNGTPVDASGVGPTWPQADKGIANLTTPVVTVAPDAPGDKCTFWNQYYPSQKRRSVEPSRPIAV